MISIKNIVDTMGELKDSPSVSVDEYHDAIASLDPKEIDKIRGFLASAHKVELSDDVSNSLYIGDELRIHWKAGERDSTRVVGEWCLTSALMFVPDNLIGEPFLSDDGLGVDMKEFRMFDSSPIEGGGLSAHLKVESGLFADKVYIFDAEDEKMYRSDLTYTGYLEKIVIAKGVRFWQYLYVTPTDALPSIWDMLESSLTFLKETFPDQDYGDLEDRLAKRRS